MKYFNKKTHLLSIWISYFAIFFLFTLYDFGNSTINYFLLGQVNSIAPSLNTKMLWTSLLFLILTFKKPTTHTNNTTANKKSFREKTTSALLAMLLFTLITSIGLFGYDLIVSNVPSHLQSVLILSSNLTFTPISIGIAAFATSYRISNTCCEINLSSQATISAIKEFNPEIGFTQQIAYIAEFDNQNLGQEEEADNTRNFNFSSEISYTKTFISECINIIDCINELPTIILETHNNSISSQSYSQNRDTSNITKSYMPDISNTDCIKSILSKNKVCHFNDLAQSNPFTPCGSHVSRVKARSEEQSSSILIR